MNQKLLFMHLPQGYINVLEGHKPPQERLYDYIYQYKDHLEDGALKNSPVDCFSERARRRAGSLSFAYDRDRQEIRTLTEHNYYPFGLEHSYLQTRRRPELVDEAIGEINLNGDTSGRSRLVQVDDVRYQYRTERKKIVQWTILANGPGGAMAKEWQDELGLNMYAMDMRMYDPAIARWVVQDPVVHHNFSPYSAFDNNPVFWADPSGADSESYTEEDHKKWVRKIEAQWAAVDAGYSARSVFGAMSGAFDKCDTCPNTPEFQQYINDQKWEYRYISETGDIEHILNGVIVNPYEDYSDDELATGGKVNSFQLGFSFCGGYQLEIGKVRDATGGSRWFFSHGATIVFFVSVGFSEKGIKPTTNKSFNINDYQGISSGYSLGILIAGGEYVGNRANIEYQNSDWNLTGNKYNQLGFGVFLGLKFGLSWSRTNTIFID